MKIVKLINNKKQKLSKIIIDNTQTGYNHAQKIIRNKDVKVDGKRVKEDVEVEVGSKIEFYFTESVINIVYNDDDIVVAFKPRNIETYNETNSDFKTKVEEQINTQIFAVHRLDRNTEGLVVFAKNKPAKESLDLAFKKRTIQKFYLALVSGNVKQQAKLVAYLKKDAAKSEVKISDKEVPGYEKIQTNYRLVETLGELSVLEVELVTGKTHQIRAHLAFVGNPIVGDEKYGDYNINKKYNKKYQCLSAYKMIFHFGQEDYLSRLEGMTIELAKTEIDFLKNNK